MLSKQVLREVIVSMLVTDRIVLAEKETLNARGEIGIALRTGG